MATRPRTPEHFSHMKDRGARRRAEAAYRVFMATDWDGISAAVTRFSEALLVEFVLPYSAILEEAMTQTIAQMACGHDDAIEINGGIRCLDCDLVILELLGGKHISFNTDPLLKPMSFQLESPPSEFKRRVLDEFAASEPADDHVARQADVDRHAEKQGVSYRDAWRYFESQGYDMSDVDPDYSTVEADAAAESAMRDVDAAFHRARSAR